jgi:hypothetical protein
LVIFLFIWVIGFSQENTEEEITNHSKLAVKFAFSNIKYEDTQGESENAFSPTIGFSANFGKKVSFQPELLVSFNKLDISNDDYESIGYGDFSYGFINRYKYDGSVLKISLPLLIKVNVAESFSLYSGVTPSIIIINKDKGEITYGSRTETTNGYEWNYNSRKFDTGSSFNGGVTLGVEYKINSKFFVDARYNFTPSFLNDYDDTVIYSGRLSFYEKSSLQIGVGYYLF